MSRSQTRVHRVTLAPNSMLPAMLLVVLLIGLLAGNLWAQDDEERAELLASPKYADIDVAFDQLTVDSLSDAFKVVADRDYAFYGFNTPQIEVLLPMIDNSTYAKIDLLEPELLDAAGNSVAFQLERGLHDAEVQIASIGFLSQDGKSPAKFAKAVGEISITYPLDIETRTVELGSRDAAVTIDGPYVDIDLEGLPEAAPFSTLQPVRAFDAQGRQLEKAGFQTSQTIDGRQIARMPFHGPIAKVEVDRVIDSVDITLRYQVPMGDPLPERRQGVAPADKRAVVVDPRSQIEFELGSKGTASKGTSSSASSADRAALPQGAQQLADALEALAEVIDPPIRVVQVNVSPPSLVGVSSDTGTAGVREWTWSDGAISGPTNVDTQWLACKEGMDETALDMQRLPAIWQDALSHGTSDDSVLQIVVGQYPCGTANTSVMLSSGTQIQYDGYGKVLKID